MTRKLLVVEVTDRLEEFVSGETFLNIGAIQRVHELPTAAELGRVALQFVIDRSVSPVAYTFPLADLGDVILDALTKRRE